VNLSTRGNIPAMSDLRRGVFRANDRRTAPSLSHKWPADLLESLPKLAMRLRRYSSSSLLWHE